MKSVNVLFQTILTCVKRFCFISNYHCTHSNIMNMYVFTAPLSSVDQSTNCNVEQRITFMLYFTFRLGVTSNYSSQLRWLLQYVIFLLYLYFIILLQCQKVHIENKIYVYVYLIQASYMYYLYTKNSTLSMYVQAKSVSV